MKIVNGHMRLTASDLSNHLACRHVTTLDMRVARGRLDAPAWAAPDLRVIQELGLRHERAYLAHLAAQDAPGGGRKLEVVNLGQIKHDDERALAETLALMARGVDVIAQGALGEQEWFGRPDVLRRVETASEKWPWSYEVVDTKLARETKATTILQLSLYSELLNKAQKKPPEFLWVVPPGSGFAAEKYRVEEYSAYYRYVKARLLGAVTEMMEGSGVEAAAASKRTMSTAASAAQYALDFERAADASGVWPTYPEPVEHCNICRWFKECDKQRRDDDHLSLVAGIRRHQRDQFVEWDASTMAKLAAFPIPLKERPRRGSKAGYEKVREQARVQVQGRDENRLKHEPLPVLAESGFARLPEPAAGDVFVDLEGDPFAGEDGLQYLFGFAAWDASGALQYEKRWALHREEEKRGFEWLVDEIARRRAADPKMHVYHFGGYEPGALKRLMGMYTTREDEIDRMLRAGALVDLHQAFKQGLRASVEEYSLKKLEAFYGFTRTIHADESRAAMRYIEHRLELGWGDAPLSEEIRAAMEAYNADDCFSTARLRDWLEQRRADLLIRGETIERPLPGDEAPSEELDERQKRVAALVDKLTKDVPADALQRTEPQQAQWLLAQLLDWHRRENKATWWEGYRLAALDEEELLEDRAGLAGLRFIERLKLERGIAVDRYAFDKQETEARAEKCAYWRGEKFGDVVDVDVARRTVDIKKTRRTADAHPSAVYLWDRPFEVKEHAEALFRIGSWVAENTLSGPGRYRAARDLLLRTPPRLLGAEALAPLPGEEPKVTASRIACALDNTVFAIQGPPGAGKTFTGARMICELVKQGKKIGVTALSHKVIRKLLDEVVLAMHEDNVPGVRCMQKNDEDEPSDHIAVVTKNEDAWNALRRREANVLGGTSWLWTPQAAQECVDVLFIDEAGQMALADVIAVSQAAKSIVLIGDPQQLERPLKGSHPDGAEKSALDHLLNGRKTIPPDLGMLLPQTWRLHPKICEFTSRLFYEDRLGSRPLLHERILDGHRWLRGAGLWFMPVAHEGNQNASSEEVEVVAGVVAGLLAPEVSWFRSAGNKRTLTLEDILIVAPYNAQVSDLSARLPGARIGTVDKFQGQEAPVVIYSMTTSSPEDAPRGMEFLYSLNRLNVATSRAMTTVILVGSPKLFEPECRTPRQMQLANALCAYREMATEIDPCTI
jgi:predicted RecB family nuclease